jgi:HAD superfamily hydrolase (TIGR01509 family)
MSASNACVSARSFPGLIIFDCDGVLIDSEIVVCRITSEELTRLGYPTTVEQVIDRFAGRSEREMVAEIERDWARPVPAEFFERIRLRIHEAYASELRIMPGIADVLARLRVNVCVASSSYPAKLALGLRAVGLYERFVPDIISASYVTHGKPAPDVFVYAAGWMKMPVADCLVIEDSVPGERAAVGAGMRVFGFAGGSHCRPSLAGRLLDAGAECVLDDFAQLAGQVPKAF